MKPKSLKMLEERLPEFTARLRAMVAVGDTYGAREMLRAYLPHLPVEVQRVLEAESAEHVIERARGVPPACCFCPHRDLCGALKGWAPRTAGPISVEELKDAEVPEGCTSAHN